MGRRRSEPRGKGGEKANEEGKRGEKGERMKEGSQEGRHRKGEGRSIAGHVC